MTRCYRSERNATLRVRHAHRAQTINATSTSSGFARVEL